MDRYNRGAGSAARGNYLSMWSADRMTVNRKTGERKAITVDRPHVSIYGGIQPELLHNVIDDLDVAAGLPARFLYSLPPIKPRHLSRARISDKAKIQFHALIDRLLELSAGDSDEGVRPWRVRLSEGAWEVFREFHDRVERTRVELQGPVVGSVAKMNGQVARLALVLHVIRLVTGELETDQAMVCSADTMRDAVRLADWFLNEARRVFALRSETAEHAADRKFIEWIEKNGGAVTVRGVIAGMRRFRKSRADVVEVELNRLRDAGHGYWRTVDTKGRPRREFVLGKAADCVNVNGRSQAPEGTDIC